MLACPRIGLRVDGAESHEFFVHYSGADIPRPVRTAVQHVMTAPGRLARLMRLSRLPYCPHRSHLELMMNTFRKAPYCPPRLIRLGSLRKVVIRPDGPITARLGNPRLPTRHSAALLPPAT